MLPRFTFTWLLALIIVISQVGCAKKHIKLKQGSIAPFKEPINLDLAAAYWLAIKHGDESVIEPYNEVVDQVVSQISFRMTRRAAAPLTLKTNNGDLPLTIDTAGIETPNHVDRVIPTYAIRVKKGLRSDTVVDGLGAPLVVRQKWTPKDSMIADTGLWYPVTAVLDLDDPYRPVMRFLDPTLEENTVYTLGENSFPLSADYTASIARDLFDRQTQFVNLSGLIKYEKFSRHMGLFRISAFDPEKIPVILIHGLKSTPNTWNNTLNEMMADPIVRDRYEFWTFGYPTGAPIPFLSATLRDEVQQMLSYRRSRGSLSNRVTVIAHSMGGLISKPLTQSGDGLWEQVFKVPAEELNVPVRDRELLSDMFDFQPIPEIDRVVFLAVPHQGSPKADRPNVMVAEWIIQAPNHLVSLGKLLLMESDNQLTPVGREIVGRVPTSVQQLSEQSAAIKLLSPLPLSPTVTYHSIIGNEKGSRVAKEESSDGVVQYASSSISGVASERVIKGKHGIHLEREAIEELVRILNDNVGNSPDTPLADARAINPERW